MSEMTTIDGIDYGPLAVLVGNWAGDKGLDLAPEPDGEERSPYYETIVFVAAGNVTNAEQRTLSIVRYHQVVTRKSNDEVFHDQVGYWLWDAADNGLVECFIIPRGVAVVAGGTLAAPASLEDELVFQVAASADADAFGIAQTQFMLDNAKTTAFTHTLTVRGDEMEYTQSTMLDIYGRKDYDHRDTSMLRRID